MPDVRVGLGNVLALDEHAAVGAGHRCIDHVRDPQAGLGVQGACPPVLEDVARGVVADVAVPGQLMGERAKVARTLNVVLPAQRVDPHPRAADVAGSHGEVRHPHDGGRALAVLGHPEAVVDRRVGRARIQPCRGSHLCGGHAGDLLGGLRAVLRARDELLPLGERVRLAALLDEGPVDHRLGDHDVPQGVDQGDVGARAQLQMLCRLDVRATHQVDPAGVDHDQCGALAQTLLEPGAEDRVPVGGVGPDQQDQVGGLDRLEVLGAGRGAEGLAQPVTGRGVAHPRAGVDVVVAECRPDHLLHHEDLFVGAARRGDPTDGPHPVLGLDRAKAGSGVADRALP
jgi:hypothetical protein